MRVTRGLAGDGQMARRYGMTSEFGDLYDHITDNVVGGLLVLVIVLRHWPKVAAWEAVGLLALFLCTWAHAGCQQRAYHDHHHGRPAPEETLDRMQGLCRRSEWIQLTRFFGFGTFVYALILYVLCAFRRPTAGGGG